MRLSCEIEVIYTLSLAGGGAPSKSSRCRASVSLGKKPHLDPTSSEKKKRDEVYFVVSTSKNVEGTKYKVRTCHRYGGVPRVTGLRQNADLIKPQPSAPHSHIA